LLKEAIESCFIQDYRPLEILIGDDSKDDATARLVETLDAPSGVSVRYERHAPSLGQSGNVNSLFRRASGDRLILLHDDDLLCADGVALLDRGWQDFPGTRCIYGKQYMIGADGRMLPDETKELNEYYFRDGTYAGRQGSGLEASLRQQMPNNGYLIETALAREVGYRAESEIGQSVDADFAVRVGMSVQPGQFVFLDAFTSKYRLTPDSIMRSKSINHGQHLLYAALQQIRTDAAEGKAKDIMLRRVALDASLDAARAGQRLVALNILMSKYYDKPMLSRWTLFRLLCIVSPRLGEAAGRLLRG
jgi:glycosyltransferase involved in cell wall biosynthesis